jgi:hypothetical protein
LARPPVKQTGICKCWRLIDVLDNKVPSILSIVNKKQSNLKS